MANLAYLKALDEGAVWGWVTAAHENSHGAAEQCLRGRVWASSDLKRESGRRLGAVYKVVACWLMKAYISRVGKTKRKQEGIYIDHEKFALLVQLSTKTKIPRSVLWREALDDLLLKYGAGKKSGRKT